MKKIRNSTNKQKPLKNTRNPTPKEYNDLTEEFNTQLQQQTKQKKELVNLEDMSFEMIQLEEQKAK